MAGFFTLSVYAQDKKDDTLKIKWRNSKIWIFDDKDKAPKDSCKPGMNEKKDFTHWGGVDIGVSMLTTIKNKTILPQDQDETPDSLQLNNFLNLNYGKSIYFSLNIFEQNIRVYKNYVNIVTGLGCEWNSYNFKKNITLDPEAPYINPSTTLIAPDSIKFSKNKLKVTYVKVPLLLELNTNTINPKKSFHIAGGIEVAYKLGSKTKQTYEINGNEIRSKRRDDYHLADIKYCSVVRVGYGDYFTLFGNYGLSEIFEKDNGPQLFPLTVGLSINF